MTKPSWRGYGEELPLRWFIRERCPGPDDGLIVEDLDLVLRSTITSSVGKFRLVEHKHGSAPIKTAQAMTFGLMDALFRVADPGGDYYDGWYVLRTRPPAPGEDITYLDNVDCFQVNTVRLSREAFIDWASFGVTTVEPRQPRPLFAKLVRSMARFAETA